MLCNIYFNSVEEKSIHLYIGLKIQCKSEVETVRINKKLPKIS